MKGIKRIWFWFTLVAKQKGSNLDFRHQIHAAIL